MSGQHKVAWLCEALLVSRSGYYDWKKRRNDPGRANGEPALASAHSRRVYAQSPDLWQPAIGSSVGLSRDDATASRASCAESVSLHGNAPSIALHHRQSPRRTDRA